MQDLCHPITELFGYPASGPGTVEDMFISMGIGQDPEPVMYTSEADGNPVPGVMPGIEDIGGNLMCKYADVSAFICTSAYLHIRTSTTSAQVPEYPTSPFLYE